MNALRNTKLSRREEDEIFRKCAEKLIPEVVAICCLRNHEKKWGRKRMQRYFDDICAIYSRKYLYGKMVDAEDVKKFIEKTYELDFTRLQINTKVE